MPKPLPNEITSYDLLKGAAIILMIVDHIGYFFFPGEPWFRVIGRFSAPIWFYLIGYADTRHVQKGIWVGGAIVAIAWVIAGQYIFPINILFSLAITRLIIDQLLIRALQNKRALWSMVTLLFFLALPSMVAFEYGTLGFMFAMFGFMCRHRSNISLSSWMIYSFATAISTSYILLMLALLPPLSGIQFLTFVTGMLLLCIVLYIFQPVVFPFFTKAARIFAPFIQFLGRRTLEIYGVHLILFIGIAMVQDPVRFAPFKFELAPPALTRFFTT